MQMRRAAHGEAHELLAHRLAADEVEALHDEHERMGEARHLGDEIGEGPRRRKRSVVLQSLEAFAAVGEGARKRTAQVEPKTRLIDVEAVDREPHDRRTLGRSALVPIEQSGRLAEPLGRRDEGELLRHAAPQQRRHARAGLVHRRSKRRNGLGQQRNERGLRLR